MNDTAEVTVELLAIHPGAKITFASVLVGIAGFEFELRGVRLITGKDGRREVLPPLHLTRKGTLGDGWALPQEISAAIGELLLEQG